MLDPQGTVRVSTVPGARGQGAGQGGVLHPGRLAHRGGEPLHLVAHRQAHDHGQHAALPRERRRPADRRARRQPQPRADRRHRAAAHGPRHERRGLPRRARPPLRQQDPRHRRLRRGDPLARHRQRRGAAVGAGALHQLPRRAGDRRLPLAARARGGAGRRDDPGAGLRAGAQAGARDRRHRRGRRAADEHRHLLRLAPDRAADPGDHRHRDGCHRRRSHARGARDVARRDRHARRGVQRHDRSAARHPRGPRAARGRSHAGARACRTPSSRRCTRPRSASCTGSTSTTC